MLRRTCFYLFGLLFSLALSHIGLAIGPGFFRTSGLLLSAILFAAAFLFVFLLVFEKKRELSLATRSQIVYAIFVLLLYYVSGIVYANLRTVPDFSLALYFLKNANVLFYDAILAFGKVGILYHLWFLFSGIASFVFLPKILPILRGEEDGVEFPYLPAAFLLVSGMIAFFVFAERSGSDSKVGVKGKFSKSFPSTVPKHKKNIIIFLLEGIGKDAFDRVDRTDFRDWTEAEYFFVPVPHSSNSLFSLLTGNYSDSRREPNADDIRTSTPLTSEFEKAGYRIRFLFSGAGYFENIDRMMRDWRIPFFDRVYLRSNSKRKYSEFQWGLDDESLIDLAAEFSDRENFPFFYILYFTNTHSPYFNPRPERFSRFDNGSDYGRYLNSLEHELSLISLFVKRNEEKNPNRTIYLLFSDHGESFGKYGVYKHGFSVRNEEVRVPFLIYAPGASLPRLSKGTIVDIMPSLLEYLEFGSYEKKDGASFFDPDYELRMPIFPWGPKNSRGLLFGSTKYVLEGTNGNLTESDLGENQPKAAQDPQILKLLKGL